MNMKVMFYILFGLLVATFNSLRNDPTMGADAEKKKPKGPPVQTTSIEARQAASEMETNFVAELTFPKGQKKIPLTAKNEIRRLYDRAKDKGKIDAVKLITWADEEYSSKSKKQLGSAQLKLVEDRNDNLEAYIEELDIRMDVDKISMAERPGVMESILSDEDVRLKKSLEASVLVTEKNRVASSKASKSMVMFVLEARK